MKKGLSLLLAVLMIIGLFPATTVFAADEITAEISFADTAYRTSFSTSQQVWEQNGITVTNDKASSTTNVADYSNPVRFYKNSTVTIAYAAMTKVEITCSSNSYATELASSTYDSGATASASGSIVTVNLDQQVDSLVITLGAQVRVNSIKVTAAAGGDTGETTAPTEETTAPTEAPTTPDASGGFVKTDISNITSTQQVIIVATKSDGSTYAMPNNKGTNSAPNAVAVTVSGNTVTAEDTDILVWNVVKSGNDLTFYPAGTTDTWLYCTSANNGVRVGTNDSKTFTLDDTGYLKHTGTSRYLGVYSTQDWRCYTDYKTANIANQTFAFYALAEGTTACDHVWGEGVETTPATCTDTGVLTYTCTLCTTATKTESIEALGHNYVDGICSRCQTEEPVPYVLVTDAANLAVGDKIVIVAVDAAKALSITQNTNNRGTADVDKVEDTVTFGEEVQVLTLEAGTADGTFAFNTGDGYLYAASSSNNHLKTQETIDANASWTIEIADGIATVKAQGENTNNWLRYNSSSNLFSCYDESSNQKDIAIYAAPKAAVEPVWDLDINTVSLRTASTGIYYSAEWNLTAEQVAQVESYGVIVTLADEETVPTLGVSEGNRCMWTSLNMEDLTDDCQAKGTGVLISGIMKDGEDNAARAAMQIRAAAYVKLTDGTVIVSDEKAYSLQEVMEKVDDVFETANYSDAQKKLLKAFYDAWADDMASWDLTEIPAYQA